MFVNIRFFIHLKKKDSVWESQVHNMHSKSMVDLIFQPQQLSSTLFVPNTFS